jgi:peptidoglycan/LPS O-acetylase OafA/YrhL
MFYKPHTISKGTESLLNGLRWSAALIVVCTHIRSRLFSEGIGELSGWTAPFHVALITLSGFSSEAVMVFFVISGYLVGGRVITEFHEQNTFNLMPYLIRRANRLYIVYLPILLLTLALDLGASSLWGTSPIYDEASARWTSQNFWGSLFFLQDIFCDKFGSNGAIWSLANEWWYYILFPLLMLAIWPRARSTTQRFLYLAIFLSICYFMSAKILLLGAVWATGAMIRCLKTPTWITPSVGVMQFIAFLILCRVLVRAEYRTDLYFTFFSSLVTGFSASILILSFQSLHSPPFMLRHRFHALAADASYSCYLVHTPVIMAILCMLSSHGLDCWRTENRGFLELTLVVVLFAASILATMAMWHFFERHADKSYRSIMQFCKKRAIL